MFASIFQSLTALLLAGVFCYLIFVSERWREQKAKQQVLVGVVFGILVILLGMDAYLLAPLNVSVSAEAGPLILAGYLGGVFGVATAGVCGAVFAYFSGDELPAIPMIMSLAIPTMGLTIRYLFPPKDWPVIPPRTISYMLIGFGALFIVPILIGGALIQHGNGYLIAVRISSVIAAVGAASIILTWQIVNLAAHFAR